MTLVLTTPRLMVRQFTTGDVADLHAICGNRHTMRHVGDGMVLSRARCGEWIEESLADYASRGHGAWALQLAGEAPLAGYCGIVAARRRSDPEIIYALRPELWRRGIASELVPAVLGYGFGTLGLQRIVATVRPENVASVRVLEKSGMHCAGEELGPEGILMLIFALELG